MTAGYFNVWMGYLQQVKVEQVEMSDEMLEKVEELVIYKPVPW